jgi:membrane-associated protease RseP (regulator of RpoE activity)
LIESDYTVALPPDAKSYMPFLGLVQGDNPEQAGTGAPIGGVVENSRANLAGVQPGDFIIAAAGQRIRGWGGLEEILPVLVPEMPVLFRVRRGDQEFDISVAPEGVPLVAISGAGGLHSTCYFSLSRGIPLKTDVTSADLVFTLTNAQGETEEKEAYIQLVMEYQH